MLVHRLKTVCFSGKVECTAEWFDSNRGVKRDGVLLREMSLRARAKEINW